MKDRESLIPKDWFNKGKLDLKRASILVENGDPEGAAFHLQQAVEKYLKGYLLGKGWKLKRIHDLEELLDYVVDFDKEMDKFRELCQEVTEYYIEERYPFMMSSGLTADEIKIKIKKVAELVLKIENAHL